MDLGSPNKEDRNPSTSEVDLDLHGDKDEERGESIQDDNKELEEGMQDYVDQERHRSPVLPLEVVSEGLQSPTIRSNFAASSSPLNKVEEQDQHLSIESDFDGDVEKKTLVHSTEELRSEVEDHECHDEKQGASSNIVSGDLLDSSADQTAKGGKKLGDSDPYFHGPVLSVDDNLNSQSGIAEFDNDGIEDGNFSHCMEMKEYDCLRGAVHFDNEEMFKQSSAGHSPPPTQEHTPSPSPSPSPERELSVHMGRSPDTKPSAVQDELPIENSDRKSTCSTKRTPSPEKHAVGHKRASRDSLSPPARRKSPPGRTTHQDTHQRASSRLSLSPPARRKSPPGRTTHQDALHRDSSPRKNLSASPRRRESPRRRDRPISRSPARQKDTSGHRRDHHGRSRSRSPYVRDHRRSPRRRHSPRRRSPPPSYHSRHRSPRRPWSPPTNRNTGVGRPGRNLFVAGFSYVTTERDLERKFSRFGRVTDVRIVRDRRSGDSRGFGFLSLERDEDADAAIRALDQTEWNGRIVLVEKSKTSAR